MGPTYGRDLELAKLDRLAAKERCVLLLGPTGIGKSHLLSAWKPVQTHVPVSDVRDGDELAAALSRALDVRHPGALGSALRAHRGWLVLDDLPPKLAPHVDRWLADAPRLCVAVASRGRMALSNAHVLELGPLALPAHDERSAATELLEARARAFRPGYEGTPSEYASLARALDGVPLALELAAPRLVMLGADRLLQRLSQGPGALGEASEALERATRASWDELDAPGRRLLSCASVFRGGFDVEALTAVARRGDEDDGFWVVDALPALCGASLLRAMGEGRFEMLWSIRDFVASSAPPEDALRAVHAHHYARVGQEAAEGFGGESARECAAKLLLERDNLDAAAHSGVAGADLRAALALSPLVLLQGPFAPYAALLARIIDAGGDPVSVLEARIRRAEVLVVGGDPEGAEAALQDLDPLDAEVARVRVKIALTRGDLELAVQIANDSLAVHSESRAPLLVVRAAALGPLGRLEACREDLRAALAEYRREGMLREEGRVLAYLGNVFTDLDQMDDARFCLAQAEAIHEAVGDRFGAAFTEANRGLMHHKAGDVVEAMARYDRAQPIFEALGSTWYHACFRGYRAMAHHQSGGHASEVLPELREARRALSEDDRFNGYFTAYQAVVAADEGAFHEAYGLLDEALAPIERSGDPNFALVLALHRATVAGLDGKPATPPAEAAISPLTDVCAALHRPSSLRSIQVSEAAIAADGSVFVNRRGERIDLRERETLFRLLATLVEGVRSRPGEPLSRETLVAAGWPGERMIAKAATNRLRVAIATLRKLGLHDEIVTRRGAYLLRSEARIVDRL